jgi:hypothetical protein
MSTRVRASYHILYFHKIAVFRLHQTAWLSLSLTLNDKDSNNSYQCFRVKLYRFAMRQNIFYACILHGAASYSDQSLHSNLVTGAVVSVIKTIIHTLILNAREILVNAKFAKIAAQYTSIIMAMHVCEFNTLQRFCEEIDCSMLLNSVVAVVLFRTPLLASCDEFVEAYIIAYKSIVWAIDLRKLSWKRIVPNTPSVGGIDAVYVLT